MLVAEAVGRLRVFEESLKGRQQCKEEDEKLMLTCSQWETSSLKEKKNGEGFDSKRENMKRNHTRNLTSQRSSVLIVQFTVTVHQSVVNCATIFRVSHRPEKKTGQ
jgi:hypothetical protein